MESLKYEDDDGTYEYKSVKPLGEDRKAVIGSLLPDILPLECFSVSTTGDDFLVIKNGTELEVIVETCSITYSDMSVLSMVEYKFSEEPTWRTAKVSKQALESYRIIKFKQWLGMLHAPTCEAQFRRMLQIGVVTRLYDKQLFPTPEAYIDKYRVTDEHSGKLIDVPHMVEALRMWNSATQQYDPLPVELEGAPTQTESETWWKDKLFELQDQKGRVYIEQMLKDGAGS